MSRKQLSLLLLSLLVAALAYLAHDRAGRECAIPAWKVAAYLAVDDLATQIWQKCQANMGKSDEFNEKCASAVLEAAQKAEKLRQMLKDTVRECPNSFLGGPLLDLGDEKEGIPAARGAFHVRLPRQRV